MFDSCNVRRAVDAEKSARLEALLTTIQQRFGADALRKVNALPPAAPGVLTGFPALDAALEGGGIPRGQTTELLGRATSGMTTLAYKILHHAQSQDACAIYIDLEGTFDPGYAARCGVALDRLFLVRPDTRVEALDIAYDLLSSTRIGALALDLGRTVPESRLLHRFTSVISRSGCMVLLLTRLPDDTSAPLMVHNTASALRLLIDRKAWLCQMDDIVGYQTAVTVLKGRAGVGRQIEIDITFDSLVNGDPT